MARTNGACSTWPPSSTSWPGWRLTPTRTTRRAYAASASIARTLSERERRPSGGPGRSGARQLRARGMHLDSGGGGSRGAHPPLAPAARAGRVPTVDPDIAAYYDLGHEAERLLTWGRLERVRTEALLARFLP